MWICPTVTDIQPDEEEEEELEAEEGNETVFVLINANWGLHEDWG